MCMFAFVVIDLIFSRDWLWRMSLGGCWTKKAARIEVNILLAFLCWVGIALHPWISDIAIFVLKRDVKLQLTNLSGCHWVSVCVFCRHHNNLTEVNMKLSDAFQMYHSLMQGYASASSARQTDQVSAFILYLQLTSFSLIFFCETWTLDYYYLAMLCKRGICYGLESINLSI